MGAHDRISDLIMTANIDGEELIRIAEPYWVPISCFVSENLNPDESSVSMANTIDAGELNPGDTTALDNYLHEFAPKKG